MTRIVPHLIFVAFLSWAFPPAVSAEPIILYDVETDEVIGVEGLYGCELAEPDEGCSSHASVVRTRVRALERVEGGWELVDQDGDRFSVVGVPTDRDTRIQVMQFLSANRDVIILMREITAHSNYVQSVYNVEKLRTMSSNPRINR